MGGYGSLSVINDLSKSIKKNIVFFGTHNDYYLLNRASKICKIIKLAPSVLKKNSYLKLHKSLISQNRIDISIPNSDKEVLIFSKHRNEIKTNLFIPNHKDINLCQDKHKFINFLKKNNFNHPYNLKIKKKTDIKKFFKNKKTKEFYIRVTSKTSDGAYGAAILKNRKQLDLWLKVWKVFKNEKMSSFTLSDYLPGNIYENLLIFKDGEMIISKVYRNLKYYLSNNSMTGAGSTPAVAESCGYLITKQITEETSNLIKKISEKNKTKPNGVYHSSIRYDKSGKPNITEINIGRFPSTNAIFNLYGKYKLIDIYFKILMNQKIHQKNILDHDNGKKIFFVRTLDQKPFAFDNKKKYKK